MKGAYINSEHTEVEKLIEHVQHPSMNLKAQRRQVDLLQQFNRRHLALRGSDPQLEARIQSYEQAYRMQMEATDALDIMSESSSVRERYGDTPQGRQLLMARRLVERGVRFVLWHGKWQPWDNHDAIEKTTVSWLENVREALLPCSPISRSEACWTIPSCCGGRIRPHPDGRTSQQG